MKALTALMAALCAGGAWAGGPHTPTTPTQPAPVAPVVNVAGPTMNASGGHVNAYNRAQAASYANPTASASTAPVTASVGLDGAAIGNSFTVYPRQAPAMSGVPVPSAMNDCMRYASLFGSGSRGGGGGGIPIGKGNECLALMRLHVVDAHPELFSQDDVLRAACGIEGMEVMDGCKRLQARKEQVTYREASPAVDLKLLP